MSTFSVSPAGRAKEVARDTNVTENTPRGGNRCTADLMTKDVELKTNCNTLCVTKECRRIPGEGL